MDGWMRRASNALIVALAVAGLLTPQGQVAATGAVTRHLIALGRATRAECPSPKPQDLGNFYYVGVTECGDDYKEASANLTLPQMDKLNVENELARMEAAKVDPDGHSLGEIAIVQSIQTADDLCNLNGIEAGWTVENKDLDKIRFFVYKTDGQQGNAFSGYAQDALALAWERLGFVGSPSSTQ